MRFTVCLALLIHAALCGQSTAVLTWHNDNQRTGLNPNETILTPSNVGSASFGRLFSLPVDGQVYAQPLYVPGLQVNGSTHNVVFVATQFNSVWAFDADAPASALWHVNFNTGSAGTVVTPVPNEDVNVADIAPWIGITSTPVIDASAGVLYTVAKTKEVTNGTAAYVQRIHALDLHTGADALPPVVIAASVPGTCGNVVGGQVVFDPLIQHQRTSLLLSNGVLYIAWASHGDHGRYNGWLMGYATSNLQQTTVFNTTANDATGECEGGIWQAGGAPATDTAGNIFLLTGNGAFDADKGGKSFGDSALKLTLDSSGAVSVYDYFTPHDQSALDGSDLDLAGSGATVILPEQPGAHPHLLTAAGKSGYLYLLDADNLGGFNATQDSSVQTLPVAIGDGSSPFPPGAYFAGRIYYAGSSDTVKAFQLENGLLSTHPVAVSQTKFPRLGAGLSISSAPDGSAGIVWALEGTSISAMLHAYDATSLKELYTSEQGRGIVSGLSGSVKFTVPTVVNGKVYIGTSNSVAVFGLSTRGTEEPRGVRK